MRLNILVTEAMIPLPANVECVQKYGKETIIQGSGVSAQFTTGIAMLVDADEKALVDWLKPFDGIWISNNPSSGQWDVVHIQDDV